MREIRVSFRKIVSSKNRILLYAFIHSSLVDVNMPTRDDDDDDEAYARRVEEEEAEAARITGANRAAMRARDEDVARDEALARRLQAEEERAALVDALGPFASADGGRERAGGGGRRVINVAESLERLQRNVLTRVLGEMFGGGGDDGTGGGERTRGGGASGRDDAGEGAREGGDGGGRGRRGIEFEIPIGPNGQSVRFGAEMFGGARGGGLFDEIDRAFENMGAPTRIIDMLNALQHVNWGGSNASSGTTEEERAAIPEQPYRRAEEEKENATCSVCLSQVEDGESVKRLRCKHVYHPQCIDRWLERSKMCPVCKRDVLTGEQQTS